eukprot:jgi/Chrzof1/7431/Cz02g23130.t1
MAGLPYEFQSGVPDGAPKRKMPWIQHGPNIVSDSQLIIGYLMSTYGDSVKVATVKDPALHATATAAVALCETYVRDAITFYRAMDAKGYKDTLRLIFSDVPSPLRPLIGAMFKKSVGQLLDGHGFLRHHANDKKYLLNQNLSALSTILGDQDYLTGPEPCAEDAAVFGMLVQTLYDGIIGDTVGSEVARYPNLVQYVDRIKRTYYPDDKSTSSQY